MDQALLEELLEAALSGTLAAQQLSSLSERYSPEEPARLLIDFGAFVSNRFVEGTLDFASANGALNQVMPVAGFEEAPLRFWEAYVAFEDFETVPEAEADAQALPRIRELIAEWNAA